MRRVAGGCQGCRDWRRDRLEVGNVNECCVVGRDSVEERKKAEVSRSRDEKRDTRVKRKSVRVEARWHAFDRL